MKSAIGRKAVSAIVALAPIGLVALAWMAGSPVTCAQDSRPSITIGGGKTILPGELTIGTDILPVETKSFTCATVQLFKKDDKIPGMLEIGQNGHNNLWSASNHSVQVGTGQIAYPNAAIVASSDGHGHTLFLAVLMAKTDIKAGETLRSDGYQIETKRAVKAGGSISVLYIIGHYCPAIS